MKFATKRIRHYSSHLRHFYLGKLKEFKCSAHIQHILASFLSVTSMVMFHVGVRCRATVSAIL